MELGILTIDIPNLLSCKFEMFTIKIALVIQEYLSVVLLYVLSIHFENVKILCFYNEFILLTCDTHVLQNSVIKYEVVCCHGNICASAPPTSFKARYVILKAYKETEYVDL